MDPDYDKGFFAEWIKVRREERNLTEKEFADNLGLSVGIPLMWELGGHCWAILPEDYKKLIEAVCGKYPTVNSLAESPEFRENTATTFIDEIKDEIKALTPDEGGCIESQCPKCGAPVRVKDEGRCPNCGTALDGGH